MRIIYFLVLILSIIYSLWLSTLSSHTTDFNYLYNIIGSLNFLQAGVTGIYLSTKFKENKSIYISLGLGSLSYFIAQCTWYFYNTVYQTEVPYPSYTDLFFLIYYLSITLAGIMTMLKIKLDFNLGKILEILVVALVIMLITHSFMDSVSSSSPATLIESILNYAYPAMDAVLISLTLAAIRSQYGRVQPMLLYFMASFIMLTFGDTIFSYQTSIDVYYNGNFVDVFFTLSGYFLAMGIINMPSLLSTQDKKLT